ncbi:zinc transporter ZIP1-like [Adelges cooleyi]|uniref:zinc transporter ZIP1-like n=1 Tax=Adelges cooleyi TaxID=133065 RepID=UPI00217F3130|nr:zinc transporter ZIP1-like [Adelges cooleyi]
MAASGNSTDTTVTSTSTFAVVDEITMAKTLAMIVLGLGSFVLGVIPIKLAKWWHKEPAAVEAASSNSAGHSHHHGAASSSPVVSLLLCFGGGVLLFTTLLHLQPEVREGVRNLQEAGMLPDGLSSLGDLIFCAGFFLVYFLDEIVHSVLDKCSVDSDDDTEAVLHRSMSLRRCTMSIPRASLTGSPTSVPSVTGASTASINELLKESKDKRYHASWKNRQIRDAEEQTKPAADAGRGTTANRSFRGLFAVLALSFHEIFEGLAIGLEERIENVWYLFIAVATHKLVIAFCVGLELAWSKTRVPVLVMYVATFAVVTPVGIAGGMWLVRYGASGTIDGSPGTVAVVLQGLAAGTLLYVVFFEVLARHKQSGFLHLLAILTGFCIMLTLQLTTHKHSHGLPESHHHQHDHEHHQFMDHEHSSHVHDHSSHAHAH